MKKDEIIKRIKASVNEAHSFSENLGGSDSIHRDYLLKSLPDLEPSEIHVALLEMIDSGEIRFSEDPEIILLTDSYKY